MKILFIPIGFLSKADQNLLDEQYPDLEKLGYQYFIELTDSRVPTLFFNDKPHQDTFFNRFKNNNESHLLFTLLEHKKASVFYDRLFNNTDRTKAVKSEKISNAPELAVFQKRAIRFRLSEQIVIGISQDTKTELEDKKSSNSYFEAVVREVDNNEYFFYKNFFSTRNAPPLAFPLSSPFEGDNYFNPEFIAKRKKLHTASFYEVIKNTMFFSLWKLTDEPVFSEYLRKGGWFELKSYSDDSENEVFADGYPKAYFHFHYSGSDIVRKWWGEVIQLNRTEADSELEKISRALLGDMTQCAKDLKIEISSINDENKSDYEWATLNLDYSNNLPVLKEGHRKYINDFNKDLEDKELQYFFEEKILINSDRDLPEHDKTLHLLAQYLCKCPLENFDSGVNPVDLSNTWNLMLSFFIKSYKCTEFSKLIDEFKENFSIEFEYDAKDKSCTYNDLSNKEKLQLRLMLPPDTKLIASASNILDNSNAVLDSNFILG